MGGCSNVYLLVCSALLEVGSDVTRLLAECLNGPHMRGAVRAKVFEVAAHVTLFLGAGAAERKIGRMAE